MNDLTRGLLIMLLSFATSAVAAAWVVKPDTEKLMNRIENQIIEGNPPPHLCELHSRIGLVSIYVISNPFRDYSKFERANEVCKNQ
ncbi:hypothetical protein Aeh1ORF283c [Aeromonas phage Aeh1]|uniref:Uncharacterized protein n=1 Tax=Aeromonas phage Aeh1 TaxID=2880362 RepID=Q76YE3_9CAUD|nr:hypothetical protein Aeh1p302 [Aeromonas phage Aeh1]AAQ17952.1 hypothetical protein Aeh1ORF283c [Aeromonas phage Aeh1]